MAGSNDRISSVAIARAVAEAVDSLPSVAGLHAGSVGEIATYGLGERIAGVRVSADRPDPAIAVHIIAVFGGPLEETGTTVRHTVFETVESVAPSVRPSRVDVHIRDTVPDPTPPDS